MKIDYNTTIELISGRIIDLSEFRGKVLLICNTASRCGYTPQYAELEQLYRSYKEKGLEILGFPCNQFRRQEPGTGAEILDFCQRYYDVSFQICAKIRVNGEGAHLLFQRLKKARRGLWDHKESLGISPSFWSVGMGRFWHDMERDDHPAVWTRRSKRLYKD